MKYEHISVERTHGDRVVRATLNRPEKLNVLGWRTFEELVHLTDVLEKDRSISVLVLTGAGKILSVPEPISMMFPN